MTLKGPDNAEHYRVKVGRYNDRWYSDPLPADSTWTATPDDEAYPSISTVKKASGKDWTSVALKRVAHHPEPLPKGVDARYAALKNINDLGLKEAQKRGTGVHAIAEARLRGFADPMAEPNSDAELYRPAVDAFFDTYQPELIACEFVAFHRDLNGVGYGGTGDAVLKIEGKKYLVDWKSRGVDSDHGAYPEEAAQIAGYACAQYWIVEQPYTRGTGESGTLAIRTRPSHLELAGGLIVSIKPDGFRVYPVDLELAFGHWEAMHAWWVARRDERKPIGRPWAPRKVEQCPETPSENDSSNLPSTSTGSSVKPKISTTAQPSTARASSSDASPMKLDWIHHRIRQLPPDAKAVMWDNWPVGAPRGPAGPFTDQQLDQIHLAVGKAEWQHNIIRPTLEEWVAQIEGGGESPGKGWSVDTPPAFEPPEEGPDVDLSDAKKRITALPHEQQALFNRILTQAKNEGRSFHVLKTKGGMPSLRRVTIVDALATIIDAADCDEELIRLALGSVMGQEVQPAVTLGCAVGSLTTQEAARLEGIGKGLKAGRVGLRHTDEGEPFFGSTAADSAA